MRVLDFAPHTTRIFQTLDPSILDVLKRCLRQEVPFGERQGMVKFIMKLYHDLRETMIQFNILQAFLADGLKFETRTEPSQLYSASKI